MEGGGKNSNTYLKLLGEIKEDLKDSREERKQIRDSVQNLEKDFEVHKKETELKWEAIEKLDSEQNKLLKEHAARSDRLEEQNTLLRKEMEERTDMLRREMQERLQKLEAPSQWRIWSKKTVRVLTVIGTVLGIIYTVLRMANAI